MTMSCVMGQSLSRWDALQLSSCHPHRPPQAHHLVITTSFRGTNGGTGRQSHLPQVHSSYMTELGLDPSSSISKACVLSSQAVLSLLHMIKPTGPSHGPCPVCPEPSGLAFLPRLSTPQLCDKRPHFSSSLSFSLLSFWPTPSMRTRGCPQHITPRPSTW